MHNAGMHKILVLMQTSMGCTLSGPIAKGFCAEIECLGDNYEVVIANGYNDKQRMHQIVKQHLNTGIDAFFTTSVLSAQVAAQCSNTVPIIAGGLHDPVGLGLAQSLEKPGGNITGVVGRGFSWQRYIELLCYLKSDIKNILIIYDPNQKGGSVRRDVAALAQVLKRFGVHAVEQEFSLDDDCAIDVVLEPHARVVDTVLLLRDLTVLSHINTIVRWCDQHSVTLCASDIGTAQVGASFGFGEPLEQYGMLGAKMVHSILSHKKDPKGLPFEQYFYSGKLVVNRQACRRQGVSLDPVSELLIGARAV